MKGHEDGRYLLIKPLPIDVFPETNEEFNKQVSVGAVVDIVKLRGLVNDKWIVLIMEEIQNCFRRIDA